MKPVLLVVSNGHAEDAIGARLMQELGVPFFYFPLVGPGRAYQGLPQGRRYGPLWDPPSGGFPFASPKNLLADLKAGLTTSSLRQLKAAWRARREPFKAVVAVGDAYSLLLSVLASRGGKTPLFHLQPLISAYYLWPDGEIRPIPLFERLRRFNEIPAEDFTAFERALAARAKAVYVRDAFTLKRARDLGMQNAEYAGSFAMDLLAPPRRPLPLGAPLVALLPGSRADVRHSLPLMLKAAAALAPLRSAVAWAKTFDELPHEVRARTEVESEAFAWYRPEGAPPVLLARGHFSEILHAARVAVGTAGTANEQAAGLGRPVVGFPTPGPQYTRRFAERQKRLLGDALTLVEPDPKAVADAVRRLWDEGPARRRAIEAGRERIGPPGALPKIACEIKQIF